MTTRLIKKALLIGGIFFVALLSWFAGNQKQNSATVAADEYQIPQNITPTPKISETTTPIQQATTNLKDIAIPILMYHHIRDYSSQEDKVGTNLSVSPERFTSQLNLIVKEGYQTITFNDILTGNIPEKPIILTFDDGYQNFYDNAYPELKKRNMKAVNYVITNFLTNDNYMNEEEIREIAKNGVEIGSHTKSHPDLSTQSQENVLTEIVESKNILENITGEKIISICYPSGKYNTSVADQVKEAGYTFATTTKSGIAKFSSTLDLQRYRVNADTNISSFLK